MNKKKKALLSIYAIVFILVMIFCITKILAEGVVGKEGTITQSTQWGWYQLTEEGEIEYSDNGYTGEKMGEYETLGEALEAARNGIGYEEESTKGWIFCIEHGYPLPTISKKDNIYQLSTGGDLNSRFHNATEANNILGSQTNSTDLTTEEKSALEDLSGIGQGIKYNEQRTYNSFQNSGYEFWARRLDTSRARITEVSTEDGTMDWASGYVLANADLSSTIEENEAQLALWKVLNFNPAKDSAISESDLYKRAKAFEKYKDNSTGEGPKLNTDSEGEYKYRFVSAGNYLIAGPINIEYGDLEVEYNDMLLEVMQIEDIKVYGTTANGEMVEITDYEFADKDGNQLADMAGTIDGQKFPKTGTDFYIKLSYENPMYTQIKTIDSFEVSFYELDLRASAYQVEDVDVIYTQWKPNNLVYEKCILEHTYYGGGNWELAAYTSFCSGKHDWNSYYVDTDGNMWVWHYDKKTYTETRTSHIKTTEAHNTCNFGHTDCTVRQTGHGTVDENLSKSILIKQKDNTGVPAQKLWLLHKAEMFWRKYKLVVLFGPENEPSSSPTPNTPGSETPTPHRTYIDIGGKVWVDLPTSDKEKETNGILDGSDYGRKNVEVTLYFEDGTKVSESDVADYARAIFKNPTITDEDGNYMFYQLPMGKKYYVEFTYDGMTYEPTKYLAGESEETYKSDPNNFKEETSKVEEEIGREDFNKKFEEISGIGSSSLSGGYTYGKSTSVTPLKYRSRIFSKNFESRLITTDNEADVEDNAKATGKALTEYEIKARSKLDYPFTDDYTIWSVENTDELAYLRHVNLGLKLRQKADFALQTQIKAGATTIKDKEKVVFYKSNVKDEDLVIDGTATTDEYIKQEIAVTDYNWKKEFNNIYDINPGYEIVKDKLNVYVLYRIVIQNQCESEDNYGIITSLVDYFDNKLEMVPEDEKQKVSKLFTANGFTVPSGVMSWVENSNITVNWTQKGNQGKYTKIETTGLNLEVGKDSNLSAVYLILKVKENGDVLYTGLENNGNGIENIAEIASYKVLNKDGSVAGLVDRDSAPYNATPGRKETYEDDTDPAPMFQLILNWEPRRISGNVWDDVNKDAQLNGENGIKNVEVELIEYVYKDGQVNLVVRPGIKLTDKSISVNRNDNVRTDKSGNYEFYVEGGNYAIRFTYGDIVMLKDGTSKKYNAQDYQAAQPYTSLSSMSAYKQEYSRAFATEADLISYLKGDLKLVINDLEGLQSEYETRNWSVDTNTNRSTARDRADIRAEIIKNTVELTNSNAELLNKLNGENGISDEDARMLTGNDNITESNYTYMEALSDIVVISSNDLVKTDKVINLGLQEREKASLKLEKKITRIVLKTNDGKTLIDTADSAKQTNLAKNPATDVNDPLSEIQTTLMYLDASLMEGATIDIDYEIIVKNDAENDDRLNDYVYVDNAEVQDTSTMKKLMEYLNSEYKFNLVSLESPLPIRANTIYDYVNINLEYRSADNGAGDSIWTKVYDEDDKKLDNINDKWLAENVKNMLPRTQKRVSKVLATNENAATTNPETGNLLAGQEQKVEVHLGISLAEDTGAEADNQLVYQNCAEVVQVYSASGRRDYDTVPGDYVPYEDPADDDDDADLTGTTTIIPPTGQNRIYYVITIISATIVIAGVILIKKKVLRK